MFVCIFSALSALAQTSLVASLCHAKDEARLFYGEDALKEAYAAAEDADVIILSSGTFNAVDFEKAVLLRGTGMYNNDETGTGETVVRGDMRYMIPESIIGRTPRVEGIHFTGSFSVDGHGTSVSKMEMLKCLFDQQVNVAATLAQVTNCVFLYPLVSKCTHLDGYTYMEGSNIASKVVCLNSFVRDSYIETYTATGSIEMTNCMILEPGSAQPLKLTNSIILCISSQSSLPGGMALENTIAVGEDEKGEAFNANYTKEIPYVQGWENVIKKLSYDPTQFMFMPAQRFELTDEAATTYLGNDGKQLGLYGGSAPFNPTPGNPQVSKFAVSADNVNGQLSVKITVE